MIFGTIPNLPFSWSGEGFAAYRSRNSGVVFSKKTTKRGFYLKKTKNANIREKAAWTKSTAIYNMVMSSTGLCIFGAFSGVHRFPIIKWINAPTGWLHADWPRNSEVAERIQVDTPYSDCEFNHSEWIRQPSQTDGANKSRAVDCGPLTREYLNQMSWESISHLENLDSD